MSSVALSCISNGGPLVGGVPGGIIVVVGIVAGTVLIAVISDSLDNWWEKKKEEWFN